MFYEVKPYQVIKLDDVCGFAMYPDGEYGGRTLYIYVHGIKGSLQFSFDNEYDCKYAYRRLKETLERNGNKMEDYRDGTHIY